MNAALNWYRARGEHVTALDREQVPCITVPTLYVGGDADTTVGRFAAAATAKYVSGPYRFEVMAGAGHFITDQAGPELAELIREHVAAQRR